MKFFLGMLASKVYYKFFEKNKEADRMGIVALTFDDDFLYHIAKPKLVIAVTGTNGKTTTCHFLNDIFTKAGYKVAFNSDGCNLRPGLSKALILNTSLFNKPKTDVAIFEFDELNTKDLMAAVKPDIICCTNLSIDSMGRNGHTDYVFSKIEQGLPEKAKLILNADDLISSQLGQDKKRIFFSIDQLKNEESQKIKRKSEVKICPNCLHDLTFDFIRYNHIGKMHCDNCGFTNEKSQYTVTNVENGYMTVNNKKYKIINDSIFNIYNQLAALAIASECGLKNIENYFEEMEVIKSRYYAEKIGDINLVLQMTKGQNPVSLSRAFEYVSNLEGKKNIIIIIDDLFDARATDRSEVISYIYDTDYECLNREDISKVLVAGIRYADYKVRLLFAGIAEEKIVAVEKEIDVVDYLDEDVETIGFVYDIYQHRNAKAIIEKIREAKR